MYSKGEMSKGFEKGTGNMRLTFRKVTLTALWRKDQGKLRLEAATEVF